MRTVAVSLAAMLSLLVAEAVIAGDCCAAPGCREPSCRAQSCRGKCCCKKDCREACEGKTCQVVCTMKKVKKTVWAIECECFCPTLPGRCRDRCHEPCGNGCGVGCCEDGCGQKCCCGPAPRCCDVRSRKKLVKKEITCEVPVYKCVVVDCHGCGCCGCGCGEDVPQAPPIETKQAYDPAPLPPM